MDARSDGSEEPRSAADTAGLWQFANRGPEVNALLTRGFLAAALARRGHGALAEHGLHEPVPPRETAGAIVALVVLWSLGSTIGVETGLGWLWWPLLTLGVALVLGLVSQQRSDVGTPLAGAATLVGVPTCFVVVLSNHGALVLATHVVPAALALVLGIVLQRVPLRDAQDVALSMAGVVRGAPLVAPLVLVFLFLPALSSDVWLVADRLTTGRLGAVVVLAVGVLLLVVQTQLRREFSRALGQRAATLAGSSERGDLTRRQLLAANPAEASALIDALSDEELDSYWPRDVSEYVSYLNASERETLLRPLLPRLALTTAVLGAVLALYIYVLTAATVPVAVVEHWLGHSVTTAHLDLFGGVDVPVGPYLRVAALLGTVATATFLGFAIIEERFATALTDALLRAPVDRFLGLALPYVVLDESAMLREHFEAEGEQPSSAG